MENKPKKYRILCRSKIKINNEIKKQIKAIPANTMKEGENKYKQLFEVVEEVKTSILENGYVDHITNEDIRL